MKRVRVLSFGVILSFLVATGLAGATFATWSPNFVSSNDTAVVTKDTTHQGSLYITGDKVTIDGTVTGSVYCAGSTVTINGTVDGDVLCAGQKVTINGTVKQDVRAAGQFVEVKGMIGGSLTAFGQDVEIAKGAEVAEDVNGAAQQFTIDGVIGRDVAVGLERLSVNGTVRGNVDAALEDVQFGSDASILGNFNYSASRELSFDTSVAKGSVSFNPQETSNAHMGGGFMPGAILTFILMLAASALLVVLIAPRFVNRSTEVFARQRLLTVLAGFAFVFGGPIVVLMLMVSVVLLPIAFALLFAWLAVVILSGIFFAYWIGSELLRSQQNIIIRMLGGMLIVLIAYLIPIVNILTMLAAVIVGSGMVIMTVTDGYRRPNYTLVATKAAAPKSK